MNGDIDMKKRMFYGGSLLLLVLCVLATVGCAHKHEWQEASCETPFHCTSCGEASGEPLGHTWVDGALCTDDTVCSTCGKVKENTEDRHTWVERNCENPKTCTTCGATEGEPQGHFWRSATCELPQTCDRCGLTKGDARGHKPTKATCSKASVCTICGETIAAAPGHQWAGATCTQGARCTVCGGLGNKLAHTYEGKVVCGEPRLCTVCGQPEPVQAHSFGANGRCTKCNKAITVEDLSKLVQFRVDVVKGVWKDTGEPAEFVVYTCVNRSPYTVDVYDYELNRTLVEQRYTWASIEAEAHNDGPTWTHQYLSALNGTDPMRSARLITPLSYKGDHLQSFCIGLEVPRDVILLEWIEINGRNYCVKLEIGKEPVWIE